MRRFLKGLTSNSVFRLLTSFAREHRGRREHLELSGCCSSPRTLCLRAEAIQREGGGSAIPVFRFYEQLPES